MVRTRATTTVLKFTLVHLHPMPKTMNKTAPILVLTVLTLRHPKSPVAPDTPVEVEGQEDSDGEPSPWKDSKAKKRIIAELKKDNSTIHAMEVKEVHGTFASRYVLKCFKANYKRLLEHLKAKTGPFEEAKQ